MSVQSTIYDLEATDIRFFLSTKPIASKSHVAIWIKGDDDIYRITNESEYELINDNIVFSTHPSGKALELRVGDSPSDLVQAPNDIAVVSAIAGEVVIVADSVQDVITVSDNITDVVLVADNMTELLVISTDIDQVLLSKEYAINPEDTAITGNPTEFSSLHYSKKAEASASEAQGIVDSVNFPAGLIMEWHTDRKPTGWLWCDGESYSVFSPTPASAYDELYQVLVDATYVMTTKPVDWDTNYPDYPNGWYDPSFVGSVVTQAELDLTVATPDRRGLFVRGKDQAGSVIPARGIDTHGVIDFDAVTPSQNKAHVHVYDKWTVLGGGLYDTGGANNGQSTATDSEAEGGGEAHPTYGTTNYIIRAKGSYNGDGTGSGGTGVVPIASEIEYSDTHNTGESNVQDVIDYAVDLIAVEKVFGDFIDPTFVPVSYATLTSDMEYSEEHDLVFYYRYNYGTIYVDVALGSDVGVIVKTITIAYSVPLREHSNIAVAGDTLLIYACTASAGNVYEYDISQYAVDETMPQVSTASADVWLTLTSDKVANKFYLNYNSDNTIREVSISPLSVGVATVYNAGGIYHEQVVVNDSIVYAFGSATSSSTVDKVFDVKIYNVGDNGTVISTEAITSSAGSFKRYKHVATNKDGSLSVGGILDSRMQSVKYDAINGWVIKSYEDLLSPRTNVADSYFLAGSNPTRAFAIDLSLTPVLYTVSYLEAVRKLGGTNISSVEKGSLTGTGDGALSLEELDSTIVGATGNWSLTAGKGTKAPSAYQMAVGMYNLGLSTTLFEVGIGTDDGSRANGFAVYGTGDVQAQNRLAVPNAKSLLTKDIADTLYNLYAPTGFTGTFLIANGDTVTVTDGLIISVAP